MGPDVSATPPSELTALSPPTKTPTKRNRCHVCRKKVGLTGEKEKGGRERERERRGEVGGIYNSQTLKYICGPFSQNITGY